MPAREFYIGIDMNQNQVLNLVLENLASPAPGPIPGQIYYNTVSNTVLYWDGTVWVDISSSSTLITAGTGIGLTGTGMTGSPYVISNTGVLSAFGRTGTVIAQSGDYTFAQIASKPTTLAGYGITDAVPNTRTLTINGTSFDLTANRTWSVGDVLTSGSYANPTWITALAWSKITGTPTTASGYGITDIWKTGGNVGTGAEFIGTTNTQPFIIKTNNTERARVLSNGKVLIGTSTDPGNFQLWSESLTLAGIGVISQGSYGAYIETGNTVTAVPTLYVKRNNSTGNLAEFEQSSSKVSITTDGTITTTGITSAIVVANGSGKHVPLTITTTGTSGPAALTGTTLNIPQYSAGAVPTIDNAWASKILDHFDASKITGVADFAALNTWTNTGNGTLSNATFDVTAPNYYANYRGMPAVKFTRASSTSMLFTAQTFKQVVIVCNSTSGAVFADYEGLIGNATSGGDFLLYATAATTDMNYGSSGTEIRTQGFTTSNNDFGPLTQTKMVSSLWPAGVSSRSVRIGAFWNLAGRFWDGYIHEIITFSDVLTKDEYTSLQHYLTAKYALDEPVQIFTDGNSIFSGGYTGVTTAQSTGNRIIVKAETIMHANTHSLNVAVGGTVTDQNDFNAATVSGIDYKQDYRTVFGRQIICLYSSTNQLAGAGSGLICYNDIMDYCNNRIAVNPDLEIYIPTSISCIGTYIDETERQDLNARLRAFLPTKNIKIVDITDSRFDPASAYLDTTYYNADGIHVNAVGADILADIIARVIFKN